ncbi:NACHT, LRR and PYD domains-containing protein 12-like [Xiphophorus maculatus]|nr:NACHT, LRR and PYD domains-containing protein 12-like [Xiphophorus maculatus]XP_023194094.1 NACHT, LRR and PYD domains-containing protein 12-like [Xiphophorus maculatus]XP_023194095.1 NACHT, LRR and PYD domains-containing protein 12-like [Xiphophorus maculatus]
MALKQMLFETLQELGDEEFRRFKWFLQQTDDLDGLPLIPKSHLENADRQETVDQMVQKYNCWAVEVLKKNLQKIYRNDLQDKLSNIHRPVQDMENSQPVRNYKERLQSNLQDTFRCIHEGWTSKRNTANLDEVYTEPCITAAGDQPISRFIRRIEMAFGKPSEPKISSIFTHLSGAKTNIRTVTTGGEAGMGKTFLVHKFVLDWTENRTSQDVHLMFPLMLNLVNFPRQETFSLSELIHTCIPGTVHMTKEELNHIFTSLQTSGNSNFDKSEYKIIFILDGLDVSKLPLDFTAAEKLPVDVTKPAPVETLVTNLIRGYLLPSARLWITTRPSGIGQIPPEFIHMETELRGFSEQQKEEYFRKRFEDEEQAHRVISHIRMSPSLRYMCHLPVFCWITAGVLQPMLKTSTGGELPSTLTGIYIEILMVQIQTMKQKFGKLKSLKYLETLMKLAFNQLENGGLSFSVESIKEDDVNSFDDFSVYPEVFLQFFKEEHCLKMNGKKVFSFLHQSIVEFLAALFVVSHIRNKPKNTFRIPGLVYSQNHPRETVYEILDKAVKSSDGHLDTFLRFLLGLSLQRSQLHLKDLLPQTGSSSQSRQLTVDHVKNKIRDSPSPERKISLFPCLNELMDSSPVDEVQQFLKSETGSVDELSPSHWSAMVFILLSSLNDLHVFDLKKYFPSEKFLLALLPVVKTSKTSLLTGCNLSERSCVALSSVFSSQSCSLRKLDLSNNDLRDSGVELLAAGLKSPHCQLETLRLICCNLSKGSCETLSSVLGSESCSLEELDLSSNDLQDSGMELLSAGLSSPHCKLETLRVCDCKLSEDICDALTLLELCSLRQLDLRNNELGPSAEELRQRCTQITIWTHICLGGMISKSVLIQSGCPSVYQLRVKKEKSGLLTRVTVGEKQMDEMNRKILLIGEARAEKCALINALLNYIIGVRFDDKIWFQVTEEEGHQATDVMIYEIFGFEDKSLPYSLTIIDVAGHEGIERDAVIREQLSDMDDQVAVVCLVLNAGDSLQSSRLKHTYDSVMSLFAEQEDKCTVILITNSDGQNHSNVMQDLETTQIKFMKNEKREPFYFLFNNRQHEDRTGNTDELEQAYKLSERELWKFTCFLKEAEGRMILAAVEELHEHGRLKACIQNLQDRIQLTDLKVAEIKQIQKALQNHVGEVKNNESFAVEMDEVYKDTEPIGGGKWLWFFYDGALCCTVCEENCHYPGCTVAKTPEDCEVIKDGFCAVCTNKCPVSAHVKEEWRYVTKTKRVEMTLLDVRQKYKRNETKSENNISLSDHLEEEIKHQKAKKSQIIDEIYKHVVRLQQIDLKDDPAPKYLDLLIESGDTEMVLRLEGLRKQDGQNTE